MPENLVRYSAFSYLQQWYRTDRQLMEAFANARGGQVAVRDLKSLAVKYMVARNFKSAKLAEAEVDLRWKGVARHIAATKRRTDAAIEDCIQDLAGKLGQAFPTAIGKASPTLLSAASKFLWFSGLHDVRIYDKRAVKALNALQKERVLTDGCRRGE